MHPLLLATLMESAPVAFSLSTVNSNPAALVHADVHLALCRTIMELVSVLGDSRRLEPLGYHTLRGVRDPRKIYALRSWP